MKIIELKDLLLTKYAIARMLYGLKLLILRGYTKETKWFLFNNERKKYEFKLNPGSLVLDIGSYKGYYAQKIIAKNPGIKVEMYEPIQEYSDFSRALLKNKDVNAYPLAVTGNGQPVLFYVDGLRTSATSTAGAEFEEIVRPSVSIESLIENHGQIDLIKLNIEGAEFEILEQLIRARKLKSFNSYLIQFHNIEENSALRVESIREELEKSHVCVFQVDWKWDLWQIKSTG